MFSEGGGDKNSLKVVLSQKRQDKNLQQMTQSVRNQISGQFKQSEVAQKKSNKYTAKSLLIVPQIIQGAEIEQFFDSSLSYGHDENRSSMIYENSSKVESRNNINFNLNEDQSNKKILRQSKSTSIAQQENSQKDQNTNCITRDNQIVFDKKKLRMQKIQ